MTWQAEAIKSAGLTVGEAADRLRVSWPKLNKARRAMGHRTINDALIYALRWYIAEAKRKVAVDVAASHDDKANYMQGHYMTTGGNCQ